jgi:hypothetical protein
MKRLAPFWQLLEISLFERFREGIEQGPYIALFEGYMLRMPPLPQHIRDVRIGTHPEVSSSDDGVMSGFIEDIDAFVGSYPAVLLHPFLTEHSHSPADQ